MATPAVASLTGDFFPPGIRGRVYGMILAGELIGAGVGILVAGEVFSWFSWHWGFWSLTFPSAALVWAIWRYLPEPARGGQSHLLPGQQEPRSEKDVAEGRKEPREEQRMGYFYFTGVRAFGVEYASIVCLRFETRLRLDLGAKSLF